MQIGGLLGFSQYYGDVSNKNYFQKFGGEIGFSGAVFGRYHFNPLWSAGLSLRGGQLGSTKDVFSNGQAANLRFVSGIFSFDAHAVIQLSNLFWGVSETRKVNLYGTAGLGFIRWNSKLINSLTEAVLIENGITVPNYSYKTSAAYFPVGLGVEVKLNPNLSLVAEASMFTVFSDDVDFYNDGYPNDILSFTSVGLSWHFGSFTHQKKEKKQVAFLNPEEPVKVIDYDVFNNNQPVQSQRVVPALTITEAVTEQPKAFEFRVQVLAHSSRVADLKRFFPQVSFDYPIRENYFGGIYRYSTGSFLSFSQAESHAQTIRSRGIHDAYVVAYENNIRVTITPEMKKR